MKSKWNEFVRIAVLIIIIAIIGISYTLFWAFGHNGETIYRQYGLEQVITSSPALTFFQILVITILSISLVGSIMYLIYSHGGKIRPDKLFTEAEKGIAFLIETVLLTILLVLIIVIPVNLILDYNKTTNNYNNYPQTSDNYRANNSL